MKYLSLVIAAILLVAFGGCTLISSAPRHSTDEIATIAKNFSPICRKALQPAGTHT